MKCQTMFCALTNCSAPRGCLSSREDRGRETQNLGKESPKQGKRRQTTTEEEEFSAPWMSDLLGILAHEDDFREWEEIKEKADQIREEFILARMGASRANAEHCTPRVIKALRPPVPGVVLVWQPKMSSFQAYWPLNENTAPSKVSSSKAAAKPTPSKRKRHKTHMSRSWNYPRKRTKLVALQSAVKWLWKMFKDSGGDP